MKKEKAKLKFLCWNSNFGQNKSFLELKVLQLHVEGFFIRALDLGEKLSFL
jgi:hypothetical protein